jgi:hypothetical protein
MRSSVSDARNNGVEIKIMPVAAISASEYVDFIFLFSFFWLILFTVTDKALGKIPRQLFYVLIILRPAGRFLTGPLPPFVFAARPLAAVIRPPLLFFAIIFSFLFVDLILIGSASVE